MGIFKENSVVCFFGDSITFHGWWIRRVYEYYRKIMGIKCEMYNCGVPGNTSGMSLGQMEETLFIHNPTDVVVMFGMNDVACGLYECESADSDLICERRYKIDSGFFNIRQIARVLSERGIRLILCTPTPYDELSDFKKTPRREGTQAALRELSCRIKKLASDIGADVVDFNGEMYRIMRMHYKSDVSIINEDRVHPMPCGHELMAQIFLRESGFEIEIDKEYPKLEKLSQKTYDEWEEIRFALEQKALSNYFLYWCMYGSIKSDDTIKRIIEAYPEGKADEFLQSCFDTFQNTGADMKSDMVRLSEYTKTVYGDV